MGSLDAGEAAADEASGVPDRWFASRVIAVRQIAMFTRGRAPQRDGLPRPDATRPSRQWCRHRQRRHRRGQPQRAPTTSSRAASRQQVFAATRPTSPASPPKSGPCQAGRARLSAPGVSDAGGARRFQRAVPRIGTGPVRRCSPAARATMRVDACRASAPSGFRGCRELRRLPPCSASTPPARRCPEAREHPAPDGPHPPGGCAA